MTLDIYFKTELQFDVSHVWRRYQREHCFISDATDSMMDVKSHGPIMMFMEVR